jgi:heat shock protein HtpX
MEESKKGGISFSDIMQEVSAKGVMQIDDDKKKSYLWFGAVIVALLISYNIFFLSAVHAKDAFVFSIVIVIIAALLPFGILSISKWLAKKTHKIQILNKGNFRNQDEEHLYTLAESICQRAGLVTTPEIGIYESEDMNAFATGRNKNDALIALSTGLMQSADKKAVSAVIAHEVAHLANGDMLTLTLVQSAVSVAVVIVTFPLWIINWACKFADGDAWIKSLLSACVWIITVAMAFLGFLVVRAFSRKREYKADNLAADLVERDYMIHALKLLQNDTAEPSKDQELFAAFKTNTPQLFMEFLSSHPPLEKRIQALEATAL